LSYPGAEVVAVADPDRGRADALAAEVGGRPYAGHRQALEDARPDVVYLASPPFAHVEQALDVLDAGCSLLIEKPIALDVDSARRIGRRAAARGRLVLAGLQHRYTKAAARARALLAGRKVGLVHLYLYKGRPDVRGNWKRSWGGGMVVENQTHGIDLCRFLVGDVSSVYAQYADHVIGGADWDTWDSYSLTLRFASGAVGSLGATYNGWPGIPQATAVDVVAEGLVLRYAGTSLEVFHPGGEQEQVDGRPDPTVTLGHAFLRAAETGDRTPLLQDYEDALRSLEVGLAANESATTGKVITLRHPPRT
jgi:predicted dehydrogenase